MPNASRRFGFRLPHGRAIDLPALLLSTVVTACGAVAAAWWYSISRQDITSSGFSGLFVYAVMFAGFLGMPAYYGAMLLRALGRKGAPKVP